MLLLCQQTSVLHTKLVIKSGNISQRGSICHVKRSRDVVEHAAGSVGLRALRRHGDVILPGVEVGQQIRGRLDDVLVKS